jgi:FixJ family two-component response regulator
MATEGATVFLVDDDLQVQEGLSRLLRSHGWSVSVFGSAEGFLQQLPECAAGCLLLDIRMPGMSGTDLHERLNDYDCPLSVIYLTANSTVPVSVRAMKHGAYDFLEKPISEDILLSAIEGAVARSVAKISAATHGQDVRTRLRALTPREREVMSHVIVGRMNKQIADDLNIALRTVKLHRSRMMVKMRVRSVAQLVSLCEEAGVRI